MSNQERRGGVEGDSAPILPLWEGYGMKSCETAEDDSPTVRDGMEQQKQERPKQQKIENESKKIGEIQNGA